MSAFAKRRSHAKNMGYVLGDVFRVKPEYPMQPQLQNAIVRFKLDDETINPLFEVLFGAEEDVGEVYWITLAWLEKL
jgi:hypothetical protein